MFCFFLSTNGNYKKETYLKWYFLGYGEYSVFLWTKGNSKKETQLHSTTASCSTHRHWFHHHPAVCIQGGEGVFMRWLRESHH